MEKKSLVDVKEFNEERFTKRILFKQGESVVFILNFLPGQELPNHQHPGTAVYILVQEGSGTVTVDGVETLLAKDDVIVCEGQEQFSFKNTSNDKTSLYVVLTKIPDERYAQNI